MERPHLSEREKKRVAYSQQYRCAQCQALLPPDYEIDHIIPVALGGHNGAQNLQALCTPCHALKTQQDLRRITEERRPGRTDDGSPPRTGNNWRQKRQRRGGFDISKLNAQQKNAVSHPHDGSCARVVAGPGTGKTAVLTSRVAHLVHNCGVSSRQILMLTFTNRAAKEMRHRIADLLGPDDAEQLAMGTFHSTCLSILRKHIHLARVRATNEKSDDPMVTPYRRGFGVYDEHDSLKIITSIVRKELGWTQEDATPSHYQARISYAKNQGISEYMKYLSSPDMEPDVARVFELYEKTCRARNQIDFDDMLWLTVRILSTCPHVQRELQHRWKCILVDEFQDTNGIQFDVLSALRFGSNIDPTSHSFPSVFVVGDTDQSIYAFRGADSTNRRKYDATFQPQIYTLQRNYRSRQPILNVAHDLIKVNYELNPDESRAEPLTGLPVVMSSVEDASVFVSAVPNERAEASLIVEECLRLRMNPSTADQDIAVLMRTNSQSRVIEREMIRQRLDHVLVNGTRFFDRREVRDVLAYLKFLHRPMDSLSLERIVNVPPRSIGTKTIALVQGISRSKGVSLWEAMKFAAALDVPEGQSPVPVPSRARRVLAEFVTLVQGVHTKLTDPGGQSALLSEAIPFILDSTGYDDWIRYENTAGDDRWSNIRELCNFAAEYRVADIQDWLDQIALMTSSDAEATNSMGLDRSTEPVKLLTIHASKGTEYDNVFVCGMEEGLLPHHYSILDDTVEEERRLAYVALTRAKKRAYITHAEERLLWGRTNYAEPSRFLNDISRNADVQVN